MSISKTVSFYGIPHVYAPVGERRFKIPELKNSWGQEALNFTEKAHFCPQLFAKGHLERISEDCLYLNIWAPKKALEEKSNLPVQVYFHGGAFFVGANSLR